MKKIRVLALSLLMICMSVMTGFAEGNSADFTVEYLLDEDDNYLYLKTSNSSDDLAHYLKIKKDLSGSFEKVSDDKQKELESLDMVASEGDTEVKVKDHSIYDADGNVIMDITKYEQENDAYYAEHLEYDKIPIEAYASNVSGNKNILKLVIRTCGDIPPPYTPDYCHYFLLDNSKYIKLDIPVEVDIYELHPYDKGYILAGGLQYGSHTYKNVVYYVSRDGKVTNIESQLPKIASSNNPQGYDIKYIGSNNKHFTVVSRVIEDYDMLQAPVFYDLDSALKITKRIAENQGVTDIYLADDNHYLGHNGYYLSQDNQLYYLMDGGVGIVNATLSKAITTTNTANHVTDNFVGKTFKKSQSKYSIESGDLRKTIPIYAIEGKDYFIAEDLAHYGYTLNWDEKSRISTLNYDGDDFAGTEVYVKESGKILDSDVKVMISGVLVDSYNIGGYSLVSIDDENLSLNFLKAPDKPVGTVMGDVLYSDIKTYFNGEQINGLNVNNHMAISIRDIRGKGYDVLFDDYSKHVDIVTNSIDDDSWATPILVDKKSLKVGDVIGHILSTDITVSINDKEIPAYNYDGYMVIMAKDLSDYGIEVNFSDAEKILKLTTK